MGLWETRFSGCGAFWLLASPETRCDCCCCTFADKCCAFYLLPHSYCAEGSAALLTSASMVLGSHESAASASLSFWILAPFTRFHCPPLILISSPRKLIIPLCNSLFICSYPSCYRHFLTILPVRGDGLIIDQCWTFEHSIDSICRSARMSCINTVHNEGNEFLDVASSLGLIWILI